MGESREAAQRPTGEVGTPQVPLSRPVPPRVRSSDPTSGTDTVTIACRVPNGLVLHVDRMVEYTEQVMGGGVRTGVVAEADPQTYTLAGPAIDIARLTRDQGLDKLVAAGFGLTPGVPTEFWEAWLEQNRDSHLVRNHMVFAQPNEMRARAQAKEMRDVRSGMEAIDPDNPQARMPASRFRITKGDGAAAS